ncbi:hypothetical protein Peur_003757 [Populus x canadensis]
MTKLLWDFAQQRVHAQQSKGLLSTKARYQGHHSFLRISQLMQSQFELNHLSTPKYLTRFQSIKNSGSYSKNLMAEMY